VLGTRHLRKSSGKAIYRGAGSVAHGYTARSLLVVGRNKDDRTQLTMCHAKCNYAEIGPTQGYRLVSNGRDVPPRFEWTGQVDDVTADELTSNEKSGPTSNESKSSIEEAADFLMAILSDGPMAVNEIMKLSKESGISHDALQSGKARMKKLHPGYDCTAMKEKTFKGKWSWQLIHDESIEKSASDRADSCEPKKSGNRIKIRIGDKKIRLNS
jgi:hypothetical protein